MEWSDIVPKKEPIQNHADIQEIAKWSDSSIIYR